MYNCITFIVLALSLLMTAPSSFMAVSPLAASPVTAPAPPSVMLAPAPLL